MKVKHKNSLQEMRADKTSSRVISWIFSVKGWVGGERGREGNLVLPKLMTRELVSEWERERERDKELENDKFTSTMKHFSCMKFHHF